MKKTTKKSSKLMDKLTKKIAKRKEIKKQEKSITLNDVLYKLEEWADDKNVSFVGSFMSFDDDDPEKGEGRIVAFGTKESVKIHLEEVTKSVDKEEDDFINF